MTTSMILFSSTPAVNYIISHHISASLEPPALSRSDIRLDLPHSRPRTVTVPEHPKAILLNNQCTHRSSFFEKTTQLTGVENARHNFYPIIAPPARAPYRTPNTSTPRSPYRDVLTHLSFVESITTGSTCSVCPSAGRTLANAVQLSTVCSRTES